MHYRTLGRCAIKVSALGLGSGGASRLGQASGKSERESVALVRYALELGINLIDTAELYGTEALIGKAVAGYPRDDIVLSTKKSLTGSHGGLISAAELRAGLEASLRRLGTDYVDIYHLHGVAPHEYPHARDVLVPELIRLRETGKVRFIGLTESRAHDPRHLMLTTALGDRFWDVVLVAFGPDNTSARERILPAASSGGMGVLAMGARRGAAEVDGVVNGSLGCSDKTAGSHGTYRCCLSEPGIHSVLFGTGERRHLEQNVESLLAHPL